MIKLQLHSIVESIDATDPRTSGVLTPIRIEIETHNNHRTRTGRSQIERELSGNAALICACGRAKRRVQKVCAQCCHRIFEEQGRLSAEEIA